MEHIVESIEINVPVDIVFSFITDVESRLRLCPAYEVVRFENLSGSEI